jgi:hypothetical protein
MATAVFDHDGSFSSSFEHYFLSSEVVSQSLSSLPVDSSNYLTLELRMDLYPEEIGFQVRVENIDGAGATEKRSSEVIFFRPPRFYNISHTNRVVHETIPIPDGSWRPLKHFTLVMIDSFGDGLCCGWQGRSSETGYTLYKGDPNQGEVLVSSSFTSTGREMYSFSIPTPVESDDAKADIASVDDLIDPAEVNVVVVLSLDGKPYETGYDIVDAEGLSVVDVMPGAYREENVTVKETHSLVPGVYTFTISDTHGDGIVTGPGEAAYEVLLTGFNRLTVLSGVGQFGARQSHSFVLEGELASIPLLVKIDDENDSHEVGFQVERLDLPDAEALVATFSPGQHLNFDGGVAGSLVLQQGGLYRLKLFHRAARNLTGISTRIAMGSHATLRDLDISQQPRFLAQLGGEQPLPTLDRTTNNGLLLSLSIPSELNSQEIDWVLLAVNPGTTHKRPYSNHRVIAFGPDRTAIHEEFRNDASTIPVPLDLADPKQTFLLIVSHSVGDGCCDGAAGTGLIQLFQGLPDDNEVLIATSFDGDSRLVERFHLLLDPGTAFLDSLTGTTESPSNTGFLGTVLICCILFLLLGYVVMKMSRADNKLQ